MAIKLLGHKGPVYMARFEPKGAYVITAGHDKLVNVFNVAQRSSDKLTPVASFIGHTWEVYDVCVSLDGKTIVSGGVDKTLFLWDTAEQRIIRKFTGHHQAINAVSFGGVESCIVASASYDRSLRLWDSRSGERYPLMILTDAKDSVTSVSIVDTMICSGSVDGFIRTYDVRKGILRSDTYNKSPVGSVRLSCEARTILAASLDSTLRLYDVRTGSILNTFTGYFNEKYAHQATFYDCDGRVAIGGEDGSIYGWDLVKETGSPTMIKINENRMSILSVTCHPIKEEVLVASCADGTVSVVNTSG